MVDEPANVEALDSSSGLAAPQLAFTTVALLESDLSTSAARTSSAPGRGSLDRTCATGAGASWILKPTIADCVAISSRARRSINQRPDALLSDPSCPLFMLACQYITAALGGQMVVASSLVESSSSS